MAERRFRLTHLTMLGLLIERPRGTGDLADAMNIDASAASRLANEMVRQGLLSRQQQTADLRSVTFMPTERGRDFLRKAKAAALAWTA